jgi:AraC-like DNA-binding protein
LNEDCYLILNDRQHYTITIDSPQAATTFCLFFQRGFVEDVHRTMITAEEKLCDFPRGANGCALEFFNRLEPQDSGVLGLLREFRAAIRSGRMSFAEWDRFFLRIAAQLARERRDTARAIGNLPATRAATRVEIYRRLLRGRDLLLSSLGETVRLKDLAAASCLSPFHFQRSFASVFHQTPHQYLTRHRLQRAAHLLRQTSLTVTEICLDTGFQSPATFSQLFHRHYGTPPRRYRRAN